MSQLRNILLEIQKEKTLKLLLGDNYEKATEEEKQHFLGIVNEQIERDVDSLLREYIISYQSNAPEKRKSNKLRWIYIVVNVIGSLLGAYAVNEEAWVFVTGIGFLMVVNQGLPFIYEKE